jgi:hypothetical protein
MRGGRYDSGDFTNACTRRIWGATACAVRVQDFPCHRLPGSPAVQPTGRPPPTAFTDESERRGRESRLSSDGGGGGGPRTCWMLVAGEGATEEGRHRGGEGEVGDRCGKWRGTRVRSTGVWPGVTPPTTGARRGIRDLPDCLPGVVGATGLLLGSPVFGKQM